MKITVLEESTYEEFVSNIENKKYMIVYCKYKWDDSHVCLDVAHTRYGKKNEVNIGARGIGYFSTFLDQKIRSFKLEGLKQVIYGFVAIEEPEIKKAM